MAGVRVTRVRRRDDAVDDKVGVIGDGRVYAAPALGLGAALLIGRAGSPQRAASDSEIDFFFFPIFHRFAIPFIAVAYQVRQILLLCGFFSVFFVTAIRLHGVSGGGAGPSHVLSSVERHNLWGSVARAHCLHSAL